MKTVKRMIMGHTSDNGSLDTDKFQRAILQYRNTPDPQTKMSPANTVFGRTIKDLIPVLAGKYVPHNYWSDILENRARELSDRGRAENAKWTEHSRPLSQLKAGDAVRLQNQSGPFPTKWDKTGVVLESRQFHQYLVKVHGSGKATLRNRKYLRKYDATQVTDTRQVDIGPIRLTMPSNRQEPPPQPQEQPPQPLEPPRPHIETPTTPPVETPESSPTSRTTNGEGSESTCNNKNPQEAEKIVLESSNTKNTTDLRTPRRSSRVRKPTKRLIEEI